MFRAAVLGFKQRLVDYHGIDPADISFDSQTSNENRALLDATTQDLILHAVAGGKIGGVAHPLIPSRAEIADADLSQEELCTALEERLGQHVPVELYSLVVEHESRWQPFFDPGDGNEILTWGADYTGPQPGYPRDLEIMPPPYVKSRGYGLGQVTAPGLPATDPYLMWDGDVEPAAVPAWPAWCLSLSVNLAIGAAKVFAEKYRYKSSLRHPCSHRPRFGCRKCLAEIYYSGGGYDRGRQEPCSWLEAVGRYAGNGPKAKEMIDECILLAVKE
jgi:hypothetical protein